MFCQICNQTFPSQRSLHAHIKGHKMTLGDYYVKFFPKFDPWTKEPIPFLSYEQYSTADFRKKSNMNEWLKNVGRAEASAYCRKVMEAHVKDKELAGSFLPNFIYLFTHPRLPRLENYEPSFFKSLGMKNMFTEDSDLSKLGVAKHLHIWQDTREQQPIIFSDFQQSENKLDFGDYTLSGNDFNYVFVDRKSEGDFKGTMSSGYERFRRELDRARHFSSYVFVVVESDPYQIVLNNKGCRKASLAYVWENMRNIILDYSDVCQFVFTGSRRESERMIPVLLYHGNALRTVDVQKQLGVSKWLG